MTNTQLSPDNLQARTRKSTLRLAVWTGLWLATTALALYGPKLVWNYATLFTLLGVLLNLAVGIGMIVATSRHLRGLDEMGQKIFMDAAVVTLGVGLITASSFEMLNDIRLISVEPQISHMMVVMCLVFLVAMVAGHRKYQ